MNMRVCNVQGHLLRHFRYNRVKAAYTPIFRTLERFVRVQSDCQAQRAVFKCPELVGDVRKHPGECPAEQATGSLFPLARFNPQTAIEMF
jgi:hypothetical protein